MSELNFIGGTVQVHLRHWDRRPSPKVLVDADTLVITVKPPSGPGETFTFGTDDEVITTGTGLYTLLYVPLLAGTYQVSMLSTYGTVSGAVQLLFKVEKANT